MPFNIKNYRIFNSYPSPSTIIVIVALGWMALISYAHYALNMHKGNVQTVKMGYMPVVANIAAPLIDAATRDDKNLRMVAVKFASFADMAEALRNGHIQAAFIIAPLSIVLRQQGEDVKVVFIGSRHESTLAGRSDMQYADFSDLAGKTVAVPMRFSGHNLAVLRLADRYGIRNHINIVEMNPPDMAPALIQGNIDAYYVGEPFAAQTVISGNARVLQYIEESWPDFICNLMIMQQTFIESHPDIAAGIVQAAIRASLWAENNPLHAAEIVAPYWNQSRPLVEYVLTTPKGRIKFDRYVPTIEEMKDMAELMKTYGLVQTANIDGLVYDDFARAANIDGIDDLAAIITRKGDKVIPYELEATDTPDDKL